MEQAWKTPVKPDPISSKSRCSRVNSVLKRNKSHDCDPPFPKPIHLDNFIVFSKLNDSSDTSSILAP